MLDGFVRGELLADVAVEAAFVGMEPALFGDVLGDDLANDVRFVRVLDME